MSKLTISDPTIRLKPGPKLCSFIASISQATALPENVLKIYESYGGDASVQHTKHSGEVAKPKLDAVDVELLGKLNRNEIGGDIQADLAKLIATDELFEEEDVPSDPEDEAQSSTGKPLSKTQAKRLKEKQKEKQRAKLTLNLNDLKWLNAFLVERRKLGGGDDEEQYLHQLMADATLILPANEIRERNAELEARCVRLRLEQDARVYNAMTRNVDSSRRQMPEDTVAYQSKCHSPKYIFFYLIRRFYILLNSVNGL